MDKIKTDFNNGNGKISANTDFSETAKSEDQILRKLLQRAVNGENVPEGLGRMIGQKIRK